MIIIIGAGPAGLTTAYYLQKRGLPYRILEKETVGSTWDHQYDAVSLHTPKGVSALPGLPMPADYPTYAPAEQFSAYLKQYAHHFGLRVEPGVRVQNAVYEQDRWLLQTTQGPVEGETLIVASGIWNTPYWPPLPGLDRFQGRIIHSQAYRNPEPYRGERALVVGGGNSGTEIAVDLAEGGVTTGIAIRNGVDFVPYPTSDLGMAVAAWFFRHVPRPLGEWLLDRVRRDFSEIGIPPYPGGHLNAFPVVGFELPEAVAAGRVALYPGVTGFDERAVYFADGSTASFDVVILATGFRPTVDFVTHELEFDAAGWPILERGRSTRNPHLFCVGFTYPNTEGWLQAVGRFARQVVRQI